MRSGAATSIGGSYDDGTRRTEILQTAATLIASSGLRTSLQEIADAAGILPGSLYHHFESKEAILVELVRRYHADLERIGEAANDMLDTPGSEPAGQVIVRLGTAIARCAVAHRAALQMSFYEAPSANPELVGLLEEPPTTVQRAMLQALRAGRWSGYIRPDLDLPTLADRMCQSMMHVGLDVIRNKSAADRTAEVLCRIMLQGLASQPPGDDELDRSPAFAAAEEAIKTWADDEGADDKATHIRAVARAEFGRKGYEVTTIRDIASAAGMGTGTVYRLIGSKDELLASIMASFGAKAGGGFAAVLRADATPVEKFDALSWININALDRFPDEWKIQLAWMRHSPPDTPNPGLAFTMRLRQLKSLLSEGTRSGDVRIEAPSMEMLSRCVMDLLWIPENIVRAQGTRAGLLLARDTLVRGAAERDPAG
ncbi:TetR/AcrR family transcriptional regulator [Mycolicibacter sp. MYC123]|uniref:TetR/AcrR family transcriptional regulator n=1 Tax=[Mycobacterium] zoologicum TaxID=2872311 RepID=A0ABU5YL67_9MYCO|nr:MULTISPECIES: TetR/AcrR family transcriptional regulator [unclassified Mycolicibacter]MEB3050811.1 TetR/AcrR family transcriptional regulator [Mycolicibacter sp. MYC123]MEB3061340.1 TetR/AcrR family transcriptional regulator [Mycolicibacter sp. MYC101]